MRIISLLLNLSILLIVVIIAFSFTALNDENVILNYYIGSREIPLPVVILMAIAFGALLGVMASLGMILKSKRQNLKLRNTIKKTEREIMNLRSVSAKEHR